MKFSEEEKGGTVLQNYKVIFVDAVKRDMSADRWVLFLRKGIFMTTVLGTRANPITLNCADIKGSSDKIDECIIKVIQRKLGLQNKVFKDRRYKYVAIVIETNNCSKCLLEMNTCNVSLIVLPKKTIEEKMAMAV